MVRPLQSPRSRVILLAFLAATLTGFLTDGLAEIGARLFFKGNPLPPPPPPASINPYRPNPYIVNIRPFIYSHIPGSSYTQRLETHANPYRFNAIGFRGPEIPAAPPPGTGRLLVLGDSVVEGHGVDFVQTFTFLLGTRLASLGWETVNVGVQGASPVYFAANEKRYLSLHPDAALIIIHENDLFDDEQRERSYFQLPVTEEQYRLLAGSRRSLLANSRLVALLDVARQKLGRSRVERIIEENGRQPRTVAAGPAAQKRYGTSIPAEQFDRRWAMSARYLDDLLATFTANNVATMVASLCTTSLAFGNDPIKAGHCENLNAHVAGWAAEKGVPFLSLVPILKEAFRQHDQWEVLLRGDYHPTPASHVLLADALFPFVAKELTEKR